MSADLDTIRLRINELAAEPEWQAVEREWGLADEDSALPCNAVRVKAMMAEPWSQATATILRIEGGEET